MTALGKAAVSALVVGLLLVLLRRAGPRAAGLAAAVPVSSVPALFWLSIAHGARFAAEAATGALWGTGLTILLVLSAGRLASGRVALAGADAAPRRRDDASLATPTSIAAAAGMSLLVEAASRHIGPALSGLVAATPVVCIVSALAAHRRGGLPMTGRFLRAYARGMLAKAAFLAALAAGWRSELGTLAWPLAAAGAAAALALTPAMPRPVHRFFE